MKTKIGDLLRLHSAPDKFEELSCRFALGDLAADEIAYMQKHLKQCRQCRELTSEFERIIVFDLPAVAVLRNESAENESAQSPDERKMLARVLERAKESQDRTGNLLTVPRPSPSLISIPWWERARHRARPMLAPTGWAIAALLLIGMWGSSRRGAPLAQPQVALVAARQEVRDTEQMRERALRAEIARDEAAAKLKAAEAGSHRVLTELVRIAEQYKNLDSTYVGLKNLLTQEQAELSQRTSQLESARDNLRQEVAVRDSLQGQLADILAQLEKQRSEVARVQQVVDREPPTLPLDEKAVDPSEAKEILGARDLHIVDVYDVDKSGKSARTYGRIYYVNHHLLVFYAFDLAMAGKGRMAAAFQAWGFRQPHSTTAESLGLFYLDNASLNRWTLRISDPEVLSRIDTLFVTVEPPGGSSFPKGRRLLLASLAGPANHP